MVAIFSGAGAGFERGSGAVLGVSGLLGSSGQGRDGGQILFNAATGNLLVSRQDEFLAGRGPDIGISRTYNSLGNFSDDNGDNWRQSTDRRVHNLTGTANTAGSTVSRTSGDGSVVTYSWNGSAYLATDGAGAHDRLTLASGVWTWTDGSTQATERYAAHGTDNWRIVEHADTASNKLTYTYSADKLSRVTTADGGYVQYNWTGNNLTQLITGYTDLATGTAATLSRTRYAYDAANRLSSVTVDLSPEDGVIADGKTYVTTYTYHGTSRLIATIGQTDGSHLHIGYDASNRVNSLTQTVASGVTRVTAIAYGAGFTSVTDPVGQVTRLDYFADGSLKQITAPPAQSGTAAQTVKFTYTANGDVATVTDSAGKVTSYTYDANGNVLTETDRLGNVVTRTYGARNELLSETRTGSNTASAAGVHTTRFAYNAQNLMRYSVSAEGHVTEYRYTATGLLQFTVTYPEHVYDVSALAATTMVNEGQLDAWRNAIADKSSTGISRLEYDARGNLVYTLAYGASTVAGAASTAEGYSRTYYVHDQAGQLRSRYGQGQTAESFVYDGLGRMVASTDAAGATTSIVFTDAATRTVVTLASGLVQTSTYNKAGELISFTDAGEFAAGGTTTYKYDANGRLRMETGPTARNRYFLYDHAGRKTADIDHDGGVTEYRYDANDRLVATARFTNRVSAATLTTLADPANTLTSASLRPAAHSYDIWQWQVFDASGRMVQSIAGNGSATTYEYDTSDRLIRTTAFVNRLTAAQVAGFRTTAPATAVLPTVDAARDDVARLFYDRDGRMVGQLDAMGFLTEITYDQVGRKTAEIGHFNATSTTLRATGTFSQLRASIAAHANDRRATNVYDAQGQLRYTVDGLNQVVEYAYDLAGLPTRTIAYAGSIAATSDYTLDNIKAAVAASGLPSNAATRNSWNIYDLAGRLTYSVDAENAVTGYSYDTAGRVARIVQYAVKRATTSLPSDATMDSWAATQATATANRVTRNYYSARGELRFVVDAEGYVTRNDYNALSQMTRSVRWDAPIAVTDAMTTAQMNALIVGTWADTQYLYDGAGRVTSVYDGLGTRRVFSYYGNGTLAWDIAAYGHADEARTLYVYDATGRLIRETRANDTPEAATTHYAYDGQGNLVSITDPNARVTTRTHDKLGRVLTETNAASGITSFEYNAFGEVVRRTDALGGATYSYYDKLGRVASVRDAENYVTQTEYTAFGEVASVTRRYNRATNAASATALPVFAVHASDATTQFTHDRLGRLVRTTDAGGFYEQYTLDAFGQRIAVRNKLGASTTNGYDRRGLLTTQTLPMQSVRNDGTVQASSVINRFEYDARGNLTKTIEASGLTEQRTTIRLYDKADRLVEIRRDAVSVLNATNHSSVASVVPTERFKYDVRGNLIETIAANGARSLYYYDEQNRKVAEIGVLGTLSTYSYDAVGNLLSGRVYASAVALPTTPGGMPPAVPTGEFRQTSYTYDALHRLATASIAGVRTGKMVGTVFTTSTAAITTSYQYDANGNVIAATDANGGKVFSYYDKLGRKTAQVDQEQYLTRWTHDAEGNVLSERRFATQSSGATATTQPPVANAGADRITDFTYDRNGNRLTERRQSVQANTINSATGQIAAVTVHSTIGYSYNGLGQVTRKTEATGDHVDYTYDTTGRLTQESRAPYKEFGNGDDPIRPTVRYYYDGIGNLTRTRQGAEAQLSDDRVTRYTYTQGRMTSMIDPTGAQTDYFYDVSGDLLRQSHARTKSDGVMLQEGVLYTRDLLGRVTSQTIGTLSGSTWTKGDIQNITYNGFGEVAQRGLNGLYQEQFAYDGAGRVYRSNSGDGVWRYFVHDALGNQTAVIESEGTSISGQTLDQAIAVATANNAHALGAAYVDGVNVTLNSYDRRSQVVQSTLAKRQLSLTGATADQTTQRAYNAFGEAISDRDARGFYTHMTYNTMGRTLSIQRPSVQVTSVTGGTSTVTPTDYFFYDASGRTIGVQDANGNRTTRLLVAGTGYGGSEALVNWEWHADGGILKHGYDKFGDLRQLTDELNRFTYMAYDGMGRLTQVTRPSGHAEYYAYDQLGQRTRQWNSFYGTAQVATTDYDMQGRVVRQVAQGGDVTTTSYVWSGSLATAGMGTFGGWSETTTHANGKTLVETSDMFGRAVQTTDMGGRVTNFTYDLAGRMTASSGAQALSYAYLNTGRMGSVSSTVGDVGGQNWSRISTTYGYDANGNLVSERTTDEGQEYYQFYHNPYEPDFYINSWSRTTQNATTTYDALGRMTRWAEAGGTSAPAASIDYSYDANGNIRRSYASFRYLDQNGAAVGYNSVQDYWYRYDAMNRVVTAKGQLIGGQIVRGSTGTDLMYNAAGERVQSIRTVSRSAQIWDPYYQDPWNPGGPYQPEVPIYDDPGGMGGYVTVYYAADAREDYGYDAEGRLTSVRIAESGYYDNWDGTLTVTPPPETGALKAAYVYDALGRQTRQTDYLYDGATNGTVAYQRVITYNVKSHATGDTTTQRQGNDTIVTTSTTNFGIGTSYALGAAVSVSSSTSKNGSYQYGATTTNSYAWYAGSALSSTTYAQTNQSAYSSYYSYTGAGHLLSAQINDGRRRSVTYTNDLMGQTLRRDESDNVYNQGDPHEVWYRFGGKQMGYVGNNGTLETDYQQSITNRTRTSGTGAFEHGATYGGSHADFDQSVAPITSYAQGSGGGSYTVRQGDSLAGIAGQLWGDSGLWYKLAEANGLTGASALNPGQSLIIPAGVQKSTHNASTFKPYDPSEVMGDTSPTNPQPQTASAKKKNKCGVFGAILLTVIAVAVTAIVLGPASTFFGSKIIGGAVAGMAGSVASQTVGVATGIQDKFNWKGVALAGISGAVGGAIGGTNFVGGEGFGSNFVNGAIRGALGSAATQGIAVATGLQPKFDWAGVAAAGIGGGVASGVGGKLGNQAFEIDRSASNVMGHLAANTAGAIANAATRSIASGTSFGDNLIAALPDVIGSTVGGLVAGVLVGEARIQEARRNVVIGSADKFRELLGDQPLIAAYQEAGLNAVADPDDPLARRGFNNAARDLLEANRGNPSVAAFLDHVESTRPPADGYPQSAGDVEDIVVTGSRDYLFGSTVDRAGIWVGQKKGEIEQNIGQYIADNPGVGVALTLAEGASAVVAPARFIGGQLLNAFEDETVNFIAGKMDGPRLWATDLARNGGKGFVFAGSLVLGGLASLGIGLRGSRGPDGPDVGSARFIYDARAGRYRSAETGRFVAARDLPWPDNAGFASSSMRTVSPGTILDRFGETSGRFLGEPGTSVSARGMAPGSDAMPYSQYRVVRPFDARVGPAASVPDFGAAGGATQYLPGRTVQELLDSGHIVRVR